MVVVAVSGGFDPVHKGHIELFNEAKKLGDTLIVILNNDNWLMKKKGYVFMSQEERKFILENLKAVYAVVLTEHEENPIEMTVCNALMKLKPDIFANGGDRKSFNTPEDSICNELNIKMAFNVGGEKTQSSSWLVDKVRKQ